MKYNFNSKIITNIKRRKYISSNVQFYCRRNGFTQLHKKKGFTDLFYRNNYFTTFWPNRNKKNATDGGPWAFKSVKLSLARTR